MDRLEFNKETPIPVIKGTNYAKSFADRDAVRKRIEDAKANGPTNFDGPYSSFFDFKAELAAIQAQKEKTQLAQQKIMRTNALGEAFRILGEGIAAGKGAPVSARNPNPFILNAVSEYAKSDIDYVNKLEGLKTKQLAFKQADVQYGLAQDAASVAKAEKQADRSHEEAKQAEKELDTYIRELRLQENQYRLRGKEAEANSVRDQIKLGEETAAKIIIARKTAQFDRGMDLTGKGVTSNINVRTKPEKGDKTKMEFVVPDTNETIYLPQGLVDHIRTFLQHGKGQYDQTVPVVLRDAMKNDAVKPEALYTAISDSWDYIKTSILPPDVYAQIYGAEPGQETVQAKQKSNVPANADWEELLLNDIQTTFDDSSMKDLDQLFTARDKIIEASKANGQNISINDAMLQAKEMKRTWRENQKK